MSNITANKSHLTRGYTIALISAGFLSTTAIFIRFLTQTYQMPALILACWRDLFVFLTLLPILLLRHRTSLKVSRADLGYLVLFGLMLAIFNSLWTLSVSLNGAAVSTVLAYCSAGFTALLGWWFLKERLDWGKWLAVALSLAGCVLVSGALDPAAWRLNLVGNHYRDPLRPVVRDLHLDGALRFEAGTKPMDCPGLHLWDRSGFPAGFQPAFGRAHPGGSFSSSGFLLAGESLAWMGHAVPAGGGTNPGRVRVIQRQPDLPTLQRGEPGGHA